MNDEKDPTLDSPLPPPKKQESSAPPAFGGRSKGGPKQESTPQPVTRPDQEREKKEETPPPPRRESYRPTPERKGAPEKKSPDVEKEPGLERGGEKEKELEKKIEDAVREHAEKRGVEKPKPFLQDTELISDVAKGLLRVTSAAAGGVGAFFASTWANLAGQYAAQGAKLSFDTMMYILVSGAREQGIFYALGFANPLVVAGGAVAGYALMRLLTGWRKKKQAKQAASSVSESSAGAPSGPSLGSPTAGAPSGPGREAETEQDGMMSDLTIKEAALKGVLKPGVQYHAGSFFAQIFGGRESVTVEQMNAYNRDPAVKEKVQKKGRF